LSTELLEHDAPIWLTVFAGPSAQGQDVRRVQITFEPESVEVFGNAGQLRYAYTSMPFVEFCEWLTAAVRAVHAYDPQAMCLDHCLGQSCAVHG